MATNFPTSLDAYTIPTTPATTPLGTAGGASDKHSGLHKDEIDAIAALETKVGINGSADVTSVDSKLKLWQANVNANNFGLSGLQSLAFNPTGGATPIAISTAFSSPADGFQFLAANPVVTLTASIANLVGLNFAPNVSKGGFNISTTLDAIQAQPNTTGAGTIAQMRGLNILLAGAGVTTAVGVDIASGGDFLTNPSTMIGLRATSLNAATVWGMQVGNYNSFHQGGMVFGAQVAPTNASTALEVNSTTGAFLLPRMTTTQKNALTAVDGMVVYDTTIPAAQARVGGAWITI